MAVKINLRGRLRGFSGGVDYNEMRRFSEGNANYRSGFMDAFLEGLEEGHLKPGQFSLRRLFEHLVEGGREIVDSWDPRNEGGKISLYEGGGAISVADFSNITGQIIYAEILQAWNNPEMLHPMLMDDVDTPFDGEKIPGISNLGDVTKVVKEGDPYPNAGIGEEWIETPAMFKRGIIVPVTKEAAFFDRTGQVLQQARDVTQAMLISKEKRCLDVALGIVDVYRRNGGAAQATYGTTHTNGDFSNLKTSNALVDWTNVEAAELMFDDITDPNTGEPVVVDKTAMQIVVPTAKRYTAGRILNATEVISREDRGGSTAAQTVETRGGNPLNSKYPILSNAYVKSRTGSSTTWFLGDFKGAFEYRQNWGMTAVTAPAGNHDEFHNDIIQQTKISERGTPVCREPRKVLKVTA